VYQTKYLNYYEPVEDKDVEKNTNINMFKEIEENYLKLNMQRHK